MKEGKKAQTEVDDLEDDLEDDADHSKQPIRTTFELNDTLYAEAELEETDTVYLWLGVRTTVDLIFRSPFNDYLALAHTFTNRRT